MVMKSESKMIVAAVSESIQSTQRELMTSDVQESCVFLLLGGKGGAALGIFDSVAAPSCNASSNSDPGLAGLCVPHSWCCALCPVSICIDVTYFMRTDVIYPVPGLSCQASCGFCWNAWALPVRTEFESWFPHVLEA